MPTILISGAANGLGAAFVTSYSADPANHIIAIDRSPIPQPRAQTTNITTHTVDVTDDASITALAQHLAGRPIDLVIHSAGIRGLVPSAEKQHPSNVAACETMQVMDLATLTTTFQINAAGTLLLFRAIMPNLLLAASSSSSPGTTAHTPKVIVMSSRMGSLGNNSAGNRAAGAAYAYRASKAALNAIVRSFAVDVPEVAFVLCHPGRVETKLVKCKEEGAITAEESVEGLLPLIERWGKGESGMFFDRFGEGIEW